MATVGTLTQRLDARIAESRALCEVFPRNTRQVLADDITGLVVSNPDQSLLQLGTLTQTFLPEPLLLLAAA